jgi:hypothetical protein
VFHKIPYYISVLIKVKVTVTVPVLPKLVIAIGILLFAGASPEYPSTSGDKLADNKILALTNSNITPLPSAGSVPIGLEASEDKAEGVVYNRVLQALEVLIAYNLYALDNATVPVQEALVAILVVVTVTVSLTGAVYVAPPPVATAVAFLPILLLRVRSKTVSIL